MQHLSGDLASLGRLKLAPALREGRGLFSRAVSLWPCIFPQDMRCRIIRNRASPGF